jgi:hypothetical protein
MTKQKHLKARVRARMSKTGESYASARRNVVLQTPTTQPSSDRYRLCGGIHPDTAAVANALANHGVVGTHSGRPLSEAMILGIGGGRLVEAAKAALADQVEHLSAGSDSFSLPAWRKWARMLVDPRNSKAWPNAFEGQIGLFGSLLTLYESIESSGYNGGSLRDLYAAFLDEAAELLGLPALRAIADGYRELGGAWSRLAETAAPRDREPFALARHLIDSLHEHVLEEGNAGRAAARKTAEEIWRLRAEMQYVAPYDRNEFTALLQELSTQVDVIYRREHDLIMRLAAAIGR